MLPNSRMIPPKNIRRRSNSDTVASVTSYEVQQQQQDKQKKGFISRLLSNPNIQKDYPSSSRPTSKYETDATWSSENQMSNTTTASIKSSSSTGSGGSSSGFGKLFSRKRGNTKTSIEEDQVTVAVMRAAAVAEDDLPKVRPVHKNSISRKHTKIPLAPPPIVYTTSMNQQQFLSNLPDQYLSKRPSSTQQQQELSVTSHQQHQHQQQQQQQQQQQPDTHTNETTSASSLRKSSGSYSIYSTFGGNESIYSVETAAGTETRLEQQESVDSFNTAVANTTAPTEEEEEEDDDDDATTTTTTTATTTTNDSEEDEDDEEDAFVDATGFSQEDIERERRIETHTTKNLTKRLSGGHFGSAGGLLLSINQDEPPPPVPSIQHNSSNKTDDELAQSMLNWKRHSGGNKRFSSRGGGSHSGGGTKQEEEVDKHASTITVIDLRSHSTTVKVTAPEEEEEELSAPDKLALRKKAEEALSGLTPTLPPAIIVDPVVDETLPAFLFTTTSTTTATKEEQRISTAELFSKTLDDVWKTEDNLLLFNDERTKQIQDSIQNEQTDKIEDKIKETASLLWKEDESIVSKERMAEWLGQGKPFNSAVLYQYMEYFYFSDMRLDSAFRKLCSKLYFKAEAQQIDRILESFANRYWDCNQDCLFGSADVVYAVVYSLLLLNTDLHVAQGNHARMTRSEFIRNTMSTVRDQRDHEESLLGGPKRSRNWETEVENYMKEMYMSVKQYQILQPLSRKTSLTKRTSIMGSKRVIGIKRSVNSMIRKSGRESMLILDDQQTIVSPTTPTSPPPAPRSSMSSGSNLPLTPSIKSPRRDSFSSTNSSTTSFSSRCGSPTPPQPMMQYMNIHSSSLFSSRPPYFKEGVVMRKHLLENAHQKARHREWKECFLEIGSEGELRMYGLQPQNNLSLPDKSVFRHSTTFANNPLVSEPKPFSLYGTGKWAASSQLLGKIELNHTLSNPLPPPGYNRQRPHVFAIQQADGGVYLFQAASNDQVNEWVHTANYYAARKSKELLPGAVGNMEYGWGNCLNDVILDLDAMRNGLDQKQKQFYNQQSDPDAILIQDWLPPTATMISSQLEEKDQYDVLQKHLKELNNEINLHRDIKSKILIKFPRHCNNYHKVLNNWETRSKYLLHDIIKYQNYCDALEKSIQQLEEVQQEQQQQEKQQQQQQQQQAQEITTTPLITLKSTQVDLFSEINQELFLSL